MILGVSGSTDSYDLRERRKYTLVAELHDSFSEVPLTRRFLRFVLTVFLSTFAFPSSLPKALLSPRF